jgi:GTP1/Obg family GTP-binding protein
MKTTWKDIQPVPTSQEFLDIVLSRTQRRLPTQIRAGFQISRIRSMPPNVSTIILPFMILSVKISNG